MYTQCVVCLAIALDEELTVSNTFSRSSMARYVLNARTALGIVEDVDRDIARVEGIDLKADIIVVIRHHHLTTDEEVEGVYQPTIGLTRIV